MDSRDLFLHGEEVIRNYELTLVEADYDVWMKRDFNPNGDPDYNYMLCYVDDLLHIGYNPKEDMDSLNNIFSC